MTPVNTDPWPTYAYASSDRTQPLPPLPLPIPGGTPTHLLTVKEVCERLALKKTKVYEMCARGELPTVKAGRSVRVPAHLLDRWIEANTQEGYELR